MQAKLFPNIRKITTAFWVSILCVTLSVLTLRLTAFSDRAVAPESAESMMQDSEDGAYRLSNKIHFATPDAKGKLFLSNLTDDMVLKVNIILTDTEKSILSTGFLYPGDSLDARRLDPTGRMLEDGIYDCIAQVAAYNQDDITKVVGTSEMELQIYIGEKPRK